MTSEGPNAGSDVSPGLQPRPSLSELDREATRSAVQVSPGLQPRPSLSDRDPHPYVRQDGSVAGVTAPALIERPPPPVSRLVDTQCRRGYSPGPH